MSTTPRRLATLLLGALAATLARPARAQDTRAEPPAASPSRPRMASAMPPSVRYPPPTPSDAEAEPATFDPFQEPATRPDEPPRTPPDPSISRDANRPAQATPPPQPPAAAPGRPATPAAPSLTPTPPPAPSPLAAATPAPAPAAPPAAAPSLLGGTLAGGGGALNMIGDQGTIIIQPLPGQDRPVSIVRNFALNITDNNSAVLQNRVIPLEFYHFFGARRVYPGLPASPERFASQIFPSLESSTRVQTDDSRYVFGFESVLAPRFSVLVRQAVVTIDRPDITLQSGVDLQTLGTRRSGWSDLQISPKFLLMQRERSILTLGMGMVIPVGANNPYNQFGNSAFVFQPNLLFLTTPTDRLVLQGGLEYDVPVASNLSGVTLFRWATFAGYRIYSDPDSPILNDVYPVIEFHGSHLVGGFQQNTVNFSAGLRFNLLRRTQLGVGYAVPMTEQKQFSNEFLLNLSIFF